MAGDRTVMAKPNRSLLLHARRDPSLVALAAAQRPATNVAAQAVVHAMGRPLVQKIEDQVVDAQRLRDVVTGARMLGRRLGGQPRDVLRPVFARPQEER